VQTIATKNQWHNFQGDTAMGGPIVRTGTTPKFWQNWESVFGSKKSGRSTVKAAAAKSPKAKKTATKGAAKKAGKKK
jgi:hypothetical protein